MPTLSTTSKSIWPVLLTVIIEYQMTLWCTCKAKSVSPLAHRPLKPANGNVHILHLSSTIRVSAILSFHGPGTTVWFRWSNKHFVVTSLTKLSQETLSVWRSSMAWWWNCSAQFAIRKWWLSMFMCREAPIAVDADFSTTHELRNHILWPTTHLLEASQVKLALHCFTNQTCSMSEAWGKGVADKTLVTFHYTDWFTGILILACYTPHIGG